MNFLDFLKKQNGVESNNTTKQVQQITQISSPQQTTTNQTTAHQTTTNQTTTNQTTTNQTTTNQTTTNQTTTKQTTKQTSTLIQNYCDRLQRGDFIVVVRVENSRYNSYKGYIGEVREYRKGQSTALVLLNAINSAKYLRLPIEHLAPISSN